MNAASRRLGILLAPLLFVAPVLLAAPASATNPERGTADPAGRFIVLYRGDVAQGPKTERLKRDRGIRPTRTFGRSPQGGVRGFSAPLAPAQVNALRADPEVAVVAPDLPVRATATVGVAAGDTVPTGVRRIGAGTTATAREASTANVAVVDTGIDPANADLALTPGTDCTGTGSTADDNGHGTHVAGTIGARNSGAGVVGVAPGTRLAPVKVLDASGGGSYSTIICGLDWIAATRTDADPSNDISVANLSLGGPGQPLGTCATTSDALHRAVCALTSAGVTLVVAAGNDGWDYDYAPSPDTPAVYPEVLTVTAASDSDGTPGGTGGAPACRSTEVDDRAASFSNYATTSSAAAHTLAAPGTCITSDRPGGGTSTISGTSMAAPHVAGAAALCLGEAGVAGPCAGLSPAQIIAKLRSDAAAATTASSAYGFTGDPARPIAGRQYGHLVSAGSASAPAPAPVAPTVTSVSPAANKTAVPLKSAVTVGFSQPMNQASAQSAFRLVRSSTGAAVSGTFTWSGNTMTFRPSTPLVAGAVYKADVGTGARSTAGASLAAARAWSFRGVLTTHVNPGTVTTSAGTFRSGSASSLVSDNNAFYVVGSTTAGPAAGFYGTVTGVNNDLASLSYAYQGKNSATATQTVSLWNWTTNRWDTVDTRSVGTTEVLVSKTASGTLANYVSGTTGTGSIRLQVRSTRSTAFTLNGERMALQYTR